MTDLSDDTIRLVHAASVAHMSKPEREHYRRSRRLRRLKPGKQQKWVSRSGITATLAGATQLKTMADLET
jgi:hypothetical protein